MWQRLALAIIVIAGPLIGQVVVSGRAVDQEDEPVEKALIIIEPAANKALTQTAQTNANGEFSMSFDLPTASYYLTIKQSGFQPIVREPHELKSAAVNRLIIRLIPIQHFEVRVTPDQSNISYDQMPLAETLEDTQIDSSAAPHADKLQYVIGGLPGVIRDASGKFHQEGASTDQTNWLLDGFQLNDPVSRQLEARISTESLRSLELSVGRSSVDLGRGETTTRMFGGAGGDKFKRQVTNFVPGVDIVNGLQLTGWNPRLTFSGPIGNKVRFFNSTELNYGRNFLPDIKQGRNYISSWDATDLFRLEVNLGSKNILSGDLLANYYNAPKTGLSFLNPLSTTLDQRARRYFGSIQDLLVISPTTIMNFGYARYDGFAREVPQGHEILKLTPLGNSGNSPADIKRWGQRHEFVANVSWKFANFLPTHQFKAGTDFSYSANRQDAERTGFEHFNLQGLPTSLVTFGGSGKFHNGNLESALYLQDRINTRIKGWSIYIEAGGRYDRDSILAKGTLTPRLSLALTPAKLKQTKLYFGYSLIAAIDTLGLYGRKLDQYSLSTDFDEKGLAKDSPQLTVFASDESKLTIPHISNISLGIEQNLPSNVTLRADYLRKRSSDGLTLTPTTDSGLLSEQQKHDLPDYKIGVVYNLNNSKLQIYDALKVTFKKKFDKPFYQSRRWQIKQEELTASYVRSRTFSNSNISPYIDDPFTTLDGAGRTPWDVPNRITIGGETELNASTALQYFAEWRDGTPFSIFDETGQQIGPFNNWRLPRYNVIDLHIERKFKLLGRDWVLRLGIDNMLNRANYSQANPNLLAGQPQYFGLEPRKFVIRIRWLR